MARAISIYRKTNLSHSLLFKTPHNFCKQLNCRYFNQQKLNIIISISSSSTSSNRKTNNNNNQCDNKAEGGEENKQNLWFSMWPLFTANLFFSNQITFRYLPTSYFNWMQIHWTIKIKERTKNAGTCELFKKRRPGSCMNIDRPAIPWRREEK